MRTLKSFNSKNQNIFAPLIINFERFFKSVIMKITDNDLKVSTYKNIAVHYTGNHDSKLCVHGNDSFYASFSDSCNPNARAIFEKFLSITSKAIRSIHLDSSTQINIYIL